MFSIVCLFVCFFGGVELPLRHPPYMKPVVIPHSTKAVHIIRSFSIIIIEVCGEQEALWQETLADNPVIERELRQGGLTPTKVNEKMFHDIQTVLSRLIGKAKQLLGNNTTNLAECWMHIRTKFDGGKVVNRSQSGAWENRSMGAGLRQNLDADWGPQVWTSMTDYSPNKVYTNVAGRCAERVKKDRERKNMEADKEKRRRSKYAPTDDTAAARSAYSRHDGGTTPKEVTDDIPPEQLEQLKMSFYRTKVVVTEQEVMEIEESTRDQAENIRWLVERRKRLTASKVGSIVKMKKNTKRSKRVQNLLYSTFKGNEATRYGSAKEQETIDQYIAHQRKNGHPQLSVDKCGLSISVTNPWLAASPDGAVNDPSDPSQGLGLVEIKNSYSMREKTLDEACKTSSFCQENRDNTYRLKTRHDYFHQVQCQLYCTNMDWCDFILRTNKDIHIQRIQRDKKWWGVQMAKLRKFYFDALLPELACPRCKSGGIREPIDS